jgi:cell division inhibitor SepF
MASMWRKASLYLGLGPDDEYDDYDGIDEPPAPAPEREVARGAAPAPAAERPRPAQSRPRPQAAPATLTPPAPPVDTEVSAVRPLPAPPGGDPAAKPKPRGIVRPVPATASAKPHLVSPTSFNNAQEVADKFKATQPVVLNLREIDRDLSRRLIDFSSGLCYGLGGHMEKIANQVYLLTPLNVEVSADERRRLAERGLLDA